MKSKSNSNSHDLKRETRRNDFPESQVGFPERNDVSNPNVEMERVHVDLETLDISRKNEREFTKEITKEPEIIKESEEKKIK
jgi:hypothetical protein